MTALSLLVLSLLLEEAKPGPETVRPAQSEPAKTERWRTALAEFVEDAGKPERNRFNSFALAEVLNVKGPDTLALIESQLTSLATCNGETPLVCGR